MVDRDGSARQPAAVVNTFAVEASMSCGDVPGNLTLGPAVLSLTPASDRLLNINVHFAICLRFCSRHLESMLLCIRLYYVEERVRSFSNLCLDVHRFKFCRHTSSPSAAERQRPWKLAFISLSKLRRPQRAVQSYRQSFEFAEGSSVRQIDGHVGERIL